MLPAVVVVRVDVLPERRAVPGDLLNSAAGDGADEVAVLEQVRRQPGVERARPSMDEPSPVVDQVGRVVLQRREQCVAFVRIFAVEEQSDRLGGLGRCGGRERGDRDQPDSRSAEAASVRHLPVPSKNLIGVLSSYYKVIGARPSHRRLTSDRVERQAHVTTFQTTKARARSIR